MVGLILELSSKKFTVKVHIINPIEKKNVHLQKAVYMTLKSYQISLIFSFLLLVNTMACSQNKIKNALEMTTKIIQPPFLKAGDTVVIVAPSGVLTHLQKEIEQAKDLLKSWGLHVIIGEYIFNKSNHFAGKDEERYKDFQKALDNSTVSAIWCARGGYGAVRILDKLDYTKFKKHPKWLIGFSDITALHHQFHNQL